MSLLPWCQSWGSTQCWRLCDIHLFPAWHAALHRTTILFYCAGKVLSEGTAAHTTPGPWKRFQGDGNHVFVTLSCSLWLSSRIYTDQQKIIIRAQINYHSRKGSMSQKWALITFLVKSELWKSKRFQIKSLGTKWINGICCLFVNMRWGEGRRGTLVYLKRRLEKILKSCNWNPAWSRVKPWISLEMGQKWSGKGLLKFLVLLGRT